MITIEINTDNAAFEDLHSEVHSEVARILDNLALQMVERHALPKYLYDINGNRCGKVSQE